MHTVLQNTSSRKEVRNMENRKSFGEYIMRRRRELGMTQKEFAEKLFVTDSAVSKWERGLSYPDITLLQSICRVLEISEKELLTSAEDTEGRQAEQLAGRYLRLIRTFRLTQVVLYGLIALGCLIGNLATQHTLSWVWIAWTAELLAASLTLLPAMVTDKYRGVITLGGFTGALLLLLGAGCIYSGGGWYFIALTGVLFGMGVVFLPYVLWKLPLLEQLAHGKASLYLGIETVLLFLLLGAGCLYTGGDWFLEAIVWTGFGLTVVFLPVVLRQMPWPEELKRHKALMYFGIVTGYLLLGLAYEGWGDWFPMPVLPVTLICLALPWLWLGAMRYLPLNRWFRGAAGCVGTGIWCLVANALGRSLAGETVSRQVYVNLGVWSSDQAVSANVVALVCLTTVLGGALCLLMGFLQRRRKG